MRTYPDAASSDLQPGPLPQMILAVARGNPAIVNGEGVGAIATDEDVIEVYFSNGFIVFPLELTLNDVAHAVNDDTIDLADGIRTFGGRLDAPAGARTRAPGHTLMVTGIFHEPSRGARPPTPTVREWAIAHVQSRTVRLVNDTRAASSTDKDAGSSHVKFLSRLDMREEYTEDDLKEEVQKLYYEDLIDKGGPSGHDRNSKTYTLRLTRAGKKAFREQAYRLDIAQGPTPTPSLWWIFLTFFAAVVWLVLGLSSWTSSMKSTEALEYYYPPAWEDTCVLLAMSFGATLLTWRIFASNIKERQAKLLLMLAWIVPASIAFYILLLNLTQQLAPPAP